MEAYCLKCKTKREINDPQAAYNSAARPITIGICGICGTKLYRTGKISAHEGMIPPEPMGRKRSGKLEIVESPAKAKTVGRFLGKGFTVKASVGHVRDLLRSQLSVDVENNFLPKYRVPNEKKQLVKDIKELAKKFGDFGSGYPSDPKTKKFLEDYVQTNKKLPPFSRIFWSTCTKALERIGTTQQKLF